MTGSRYEPTRRALLFWTLFIGMGAVGGALMMLLDPSGRTMGMDAMLPYFQVLPFADVVFQDLRFSGWALLVVNGLTNLTAAGLLMAKKPAGVVLLRPGGGKDTGGRLHPGTPPEQRLRQCGGGDGRPAGHPAHRAAEHPVPGGRV